jgi:hypothetical protein
MAKVEKLPPKRNSAGSVDYIVELKDGRTVQVQINPYGSPYYYQPLDNNEMKYVLSLIEEFNAANK